MRAVESVYSKVGTTSNRNLAEKFYEFSGLLSSLLKLEKKILSSDIDRIYSENGPFFEDVVWQLSQSSEGILKESMIFEFAMRCFPYMGKDKVVLKHTINIPQLFSKYIQGEEITVNDIQRLEGYYLLEETEKSLPLVRRIKL